MYVCATVHTPFVIPPATLLFWPIFMSEVLMIYELYCNTFASHEVFQLVKGF